jgi:hypothetical protein
VSSRRRILAPSQGFITVAAIPALLIGLIILGIGVQMLDTGLMVLHFGIQGNKWIPVQAEVTGYLAGLNTSYKKDWTVKSYAYEIEYTYTVLGRIYQSSGFGKAGFETAESAEMEASRLYPHGQSIEVAYDSRNPELNSSLISLSSNEVLLNLLILFMGSGILFSCMNVLLTPIARSFLSPYIVRIPLIFTLPIFYASLLLISYSFQYVVNGLKSCRLEHRIIWLLRLMVSCLVFFQNVIIRVITVISIFLAPFIMFFLAMTLDLINSKQNSHSKHKIGHLENKMNWLFNLVVGCLTFTFTAILSAVFFQAPIIRISEIEPNWMLPPGF